MCLPFDKCIIIVAVLAFTLRLRCVLATTAPQNPTSHTTLTVRVTCSSSGSKLYASIIGIWNKEKSDIPKGTLTLKASSPTLCNNSTIDDDVLYVAGVDAAINTNCIDKQSVRDRHLENVVILIFCVSNAPQSVCEDNLKESHTNRVMSGPSWKTLTALNPSDKSNDVFFNFPVFKRNMTELLTETTNTDVKCKIEVELLAPLVETDAGLSNFSKTSVLFVSVSFIILMVISLAWLVFYYVQRFRYAHAKDRLAKRLFNAAKKALTKIPTKTLKTGDDELQNDCPVCIEAYRNNDVIRRLPCSHIFHKTCVDPWLLEHRTCPMCKMDILKAYGYTINLKQAQVIRDGADDGVDGEPLSTGAHGTSFPSGPRSESELHDPFFPTPSASPSRLQTVLRETDVSSFSIIPRTLNTAGADKASDISPRRAASTSAEVHYDGSTAAEDMTDATTSTVIVDRGSKQQVNLAERRCSSVATFLVSRSMSAVTKVANTSGGIRPTTSSTSESLGMGPRRYSKLMRPTTSIGSIVTASHTQLPGSVSMPTVARLPKSKTNSSDGSLQSV